MTPAQKVTGHKKYPGICRKLTHGRKKKTRLPGHFSTIIFFFKKNMNMKRLVLPTDSRYEQEDSDIAIHVHVYIITPDVSELDHFLTTHEGKM